MKKNGIDATVFSALKVSEKSKIPVLLISNPGVGKTTAVQYFADTRGYELILIRGNTETNESIMGYSVCPPDAKENSSAIQLRPAWFQRLLDSKRKCLLFLDEITTANEYTQSALLHLIFERKCGTESIPDDTLIVAAGNYANNLSNSMVMLPPLLSRFMIINITPTHEDLEDFLSKYGGSIVGKKIDHDAELKKLMKDIDSQELSVSEETIDKIGEYVEGGIKKITKMLMTSNDRPVSLEVTELQNIYSDTQKDEPLANFVTLRTLNYLRDVTVAEYLCFGKPGIKSEVYRNMVNGLVGLGVSRDKRSGEVKFTSVTNYFYDAMGKVANDIEKLNDDKLPKYMAEIKNILSKSKNVDSSIPEHVNYKKYLEIPELNALTNKLQEIKNDKSIKDIERPIDPELSEEIIKVIVGSAIHQFTPQITEVSLPKKNEKGELIKMADKMPVEDMAGIITNWNNSVKAMVAINSIILDANLGYDSDIKDVLVQGHNRLTYSKHVTKTLRGAYEKEDKAFGNLLPVVEEPKFKAS